MPPHRFANRQSVSRPLWDEARRVDATPHERRVALIHALLYELQPIRFSKVHIDASGWASSVRNATLGTVAFLRRTAPGAARSAWTFARGLTRREWMIIGAFFTWLYAVRFVHRTLDAGPMAVIVTAIVLIFTVGLDDSGGSGDGMSAYSVFNRGFRRMLGSLDADSLVQQYVGGAMAAGVQRQNEDWVEILEDDVRVERRQRERRREEDNGRNAVEREAAIAQDREGANQGAEGADDAEGQQPRVPREGGRSRKSSKKARRRNLEQRRELQRMRDLQREGFGAGGEQGEVALMNHIIEDQMAGLGEDET